MKELELKIKEIWGALYILLIPIILLSVGLIMNKRDAQKEIIDIKYNYYMLNEKVDSLKNKIDKITYN